MERSYGPFRRTFDLGSPVDVDGITAGFEKGVLKVHIPKLTGDAAQVEIGEEGG